MYMIIKIFRDINYLLINFKLIYRIYLKRKIIKKIIKEGVFIEYKIDMWIGWLDL